MADELVYRVARNDASMNIRFDELPAASNKAYQILEACVSRWPSATSPTFDPTLIDTIECAIKITAACEYVAKFGLDKRIYMTLRHAWTREALNLTSVVKWANPDKYNAMMKQAHAELADQSELGSDDASSADAD
jgi:hypothetical protein